VTKLSFDFGGLSIRPPPVQGDVIVQQATNHGWVNHSS
jgi:hypothetical protein